MRWNVDIKDELIMAGLSSPMAVSSVRWPACPTLTFTDATPSAGEGVGCFVSEQLAESFYDACERTGGVHQARRSPSERGCSQSPPWPLPLRRSTTSYGAFLGRPLRSCHEFRRSSQELQGVREVVVDRARETLQPERFASGSDSHVAIGCWAKGGSSPFLLNGVMRASLGWLVLGSLSNFWICSESNIAVDPSRFKIVRPDAAAPPWPQEHIVDLLAGSYHERLAPEELQKLSKLQGERSKRTRARSRFVRGVYAVCGRLSAALSKEGLEVGCPNEAFPWKGAYVCSMGLDRAAAVAQPANEIKNRRCSYLHFGIPCTSWSVPSRTNGGTRRKHCPDGTSHVLPRGALGT